MHIGGILLVILLARWVVPALWSFIFGPSSAANKEWRRRGKVLGHEGPGPRSFKGRAGRREWWLSQLGNTIVGAVVGAAPTVGSLLALPWVIGALAVNARRLHDLSLSAWLQLVPMAFGLAFAVFYFYHGGPDRTLAASWTLNTPEGMLTLLAAIVGVIYLLFYAWIGFTPGRRGSNAYGEADPT